MRTLHFASFCATAAAALVLGCSGGGTYHPPLHLDMGNGSGDMAGGKVFDLSMNQNCNPPNQQCPSGCTDTSSDSQNCGFCGNICMNGQFCSNSQCTGGAQPDLAMSGGTLNCIALNMCLVNCGSDMQCGNNCINMAKPGSVNLLSAAETCIFGDPNTMTPGCCQGWSSGTNYGICDGPNGGNPNYNDMMCQNCLNTCEAQGGACDAQVQACANDP